MKKLIVFCTLSLMASASFAAKVNITNIKEKDIYNSLVAHGHSVGQTFDVQYHKATGKYQRENSSAELVRVLEPTSSPDQQNIADKQIYTTTHEHVGKVYEYFYEYSYMDVGETNNWVLTKARSTFLHLRPIEEPDPSN